MIPPSGEQAHPPIAHLYVPADRHPLVAKALLAPADVVIIDLEDAVAAAAKEGARAGLPGLLEGVHRPVQVRINASGTPWHAKDLEMVRTHTDPRWVSVRIPKVETPPELTKILNQIPAHRGHAILESALGVENSFAIASAGAATLSLGEADLKSELKIGTEEGLSWIRQRVIVAARAAGLPAPIMSVYPNIRDLQGLAESTRAGRDLGFLGRAAIHPAQLPIIDAAFMPSDAEITRAREILRAVDSAETRGEGTAVLADGSFLDVAMVEQARATVSLSRGPRRPWVVA